MSELYVDTESQDFFNLYCRGKVSEDAVHDYIDDGRHSCANGGVFMGVVTDRQLRTAASRGRKLFASEPRAAAARYDAATGRVVIDLVNGCTYAFPANLVQDLQSASAEDLARVEVDGLGFNLHWPSLDVDLYVPALMAGIFGTHAWMARLQERTARQPAAAVGSTASPERAYGSRPGGLFTPDPDSVSQVTLRSSPRLGFPRTGPDGVVRVGRKPIPRPAFWTTVTISAISMAIVDGEWPQESFLYTWDSLHGEIEVYKGVGKHLGAMDAVTGGGSGPARKGRRISV